MIPFGLPFGFRQTIFIMIFSPLTVVPASRTSMILNEASARPFYFEGRVGPSYGPPCHSHPAIEHEILDSHHYNSLCKGVTVPFLKSDFLLAVRNLVLFGAED
jgi:hypothetical protein